MQHLPGSKDPGQVLGVTLCNEAYRSRAELAAQQFVACTGCAAAIIEEGDFDRIVEPACKLLSKRIVPRDLPFFAKLFLFDLLEAEHLVYFDADLLFVRPWNPATLFLPGKLRAVRDLWWQVAVVQDCRHGGMPMSGYVNTGLLLLNRRDHWEVLHEAVRSFRSFQSPFHEQPYLNYALHQCQVSIEYLHRDYNFIAPFTSEEPRAFPPVGLHLGGRYPFSSYHQVVSNFADRTTPSVPPAESGLVGQWRYDRVGLGGRVLDFRADGTIGDGSARCERYWRAWWDDEAMRLAVFGNTHLDAQITKTFEATPHGDGSWRGRWVNFEKCEVVLSPHP